MGKIYKTDIGTLISLNTGINISSASSVSILVKKPSGGAIVTWVSVIGSDNMSIEHTILTDELNEVGYYKLHAKVVMPSGTWHGETATIQVKDAFQ